MRLPRPRFRLRTLMVAVVIVAVALGVLRWGLHPNYITRAERLAATERKFLEAADERDAEAARVKSTNPQLAAHLSGQAAWFRQGAAEAAWLANQYSEAYHR